MNESQIIQMARQIDEIHTRVVGPPNEPEKGLVVRVDRLEQSAKKAGWFATTALGSVIVAAIGWAAKSLHN